MHAYAELFCQSNFSFLVGASRPEELIRTATEFGYTALAITDECSVAGVVRAHVEAKRLAEENEKKRTKLIVGSRFVTEEDLHLVALATDRRAYGQLCTLITRARRRSEKGQYCLWTKDLVPATDGCLFIWLPTPAQAHLCLKKANGPSPSDTTDSIWVACNQLREATQGRLWIGLTRTLDGHDEELTQWRQILARVWSLPVVACGAVLCHEANRQPLQDVLTAIRLNKPLQACGYELQANRERHLRPLAELQGLFPAEALTESIAIADRCTFGLDELRYEYPQEVVPPGHTAQSYLRQLVEIGADQRWPAGETPAVRALIEKELQVIHELKYEYYFLTVYDVVQFARDQKILCQGRGSAANSAVCFCLFITDVDPAKSNLLFERFISKERNEPPDIDVDFEHERREEVIQFLYRKYSRHRAALTAAISTYRTKSALRDVGKAMGFDMTLLDRLSKSLAWWDQRDQLPSRLKELGVDSDSLPIRQFIKLVDQIRSFPRHLSQHVGGFILSAGPLDQLVPIENASMEDRTVVQWDKDDIDALGLMKVDVLALGMLTAIRKSFALIEAVRGKQWTMATLPREDAATYALLQKGDSVGVFQVESRAQMAMLPRLKPATFYDLVIEVAIIRPGPIQGDMVHPYLRRRQGIDPVTYESPEIEAILERTLGIPIFQEQVIKLAMVAAGFTGGEADRLRRAMAAWKRKGGLEPYEAKLATGMRERGYSDDFIQRIILQIRGFGDYGFPESHAASFALLVYVSSWLKCHEPAAFCCGLLNAQPMGYYTPSQLVQDVQHHGVEVRPVDVQYSDWDHILETDQMSQHPQRQPAIRLGFRLIQNVSKEGMDRITRFRKQQPFVSLADFTRRCQLNRKDMEALAHANALQSLSAHRFQARWDVQGLQHESPLVQREQARETPVQLPPPSTVQNLVEDYHSTGLTLGPHPMTLLRNHPKLRGSKRHCDLAILRHKQFVKIAGIVTGRQRPGTATGVVFITLEDETGNSNIVVWNDLVDRYRSAVLHARLVGVKGVVEKEGNVIHVIAGQLVDLTYLLGQLMTSSRDFH